MTGSPKGDEGIDSEVASTGSRRRDDDLAGTQAMTLAAEGSSSPGAGPIGVAPTVDSSPGVRLEDEGELAPGQIIGEHYKVDRRIGAGAMGSVYVVEHLGLGKRFAVKVVAAAKASDTGAVTRLRNEARTLSAVDHENIVGVTHLGQTGDGRLFVVMELLEGEDLGERLHRQRQRAARHEGTPWLPLDEVRFIVPQVLAALAAAHQAHVVHRDLKPDNLFLSKKRGRTTLKVVDFGISKIRGGPTGGANLTQTGQILGTPLYMAPEQGRSTAEADARADIYSFGCILYELFTARPPFLAESVYDCVVKHATQVPELPSRHRKDMPPVIEALVMRCLAKKPDERFADAEEVLGVWQSAWDSIDQGEAPEVPELPPSAVSVNLAGTSDTTLSRTGGVTAVPAAVTLDGSARVAPWIGLGAILALAIAGAVVMFMADDPEVTSTVTPTLTEAPPEPEPPAAEPEPEPEPEVVAPAMVEVPAAPALVSRTVASDPTGAEVYLDGERLGRTPLEVEVPAEGAVALVLRRRGFRPITRTVHADGPERVSVRLRRRGGSAPPLAPQ